MPRTRRCPSQPHLANKSLYISIMVQDAADRKFTFSTNQSKISGTSSHGGRLFYTSWNFHMFLHMLVLCRRPKHPSKIHQTKLWGKWWWWVDIAAYLRNHRWISQKANWKVQIKNKHIYLKITKIEINQR